MNILQTIHFINKGVFWFFTYQLQLYFSANIDYSFTFNASHVLHVHIYVGLYHVYYCMKSIFYVAFQ